MTILVGIKCKDGIVIGTDSSATFGTAEIRTIEQSTKKIEILHDKIIVAGTGEIGLGQRFCNLLSVGYSGGAFKNMNAIQMSTKMSQLAVNDFASTAADKGHFGALVAYPADHDIHLCEFAVTNFQPEHKTTGLWYASMGSGQIVVDPFLGLMRSVFWADGMPSLQEGVFIATWAIEHVIQVNAGGVNGPIQMALITNDAGSPKARILSEDELAEHKENVTGAVSHLREYRDKLSGKKVVSVPDVPKG